MTMTAIGSSEIQELRERIANLEAALAALQASPSHGSNRQMVGHEDATAIIRPSRRSLLGFLAGVGTGAALGGPALTDAAHAADSAVATDAAAKPAGTGIGPWKVYSPKLMGSKVDPLLGDGRTFKMGSLGDVGPGQNGHYCQLGRIVVVKTWNQFALGAKCGEGQYRLSLPVPAATGSDAYWGPTGVAIMHRDKTNIIRNATVILATATFVTFQLDNAKGGSVGHDSPWVWDNGDGLNTFIIYEAASG